MDTIAEIKNLFEQLKLRLQKSEEALRHEYQNMKAGRANPRVLDKISINYYGTATPISQVGNITVPEARLIVISVWDAKALKDVETAIVNANIGVTPNNDGKVLRLIFPELTEETRKMLVKEIKMQAENCKVSLRNARRDANDLLKKYKKDALVSEDALTMYEKEIDKLIQKSIDDVDKASKEKETEVLSV